MTHFDPYAKERASAREAEEELINALIWHYSLSGDVFEAKRKADDLIGRIKHMSYIEGMVDHHEG